MSGPEKVPQCDYLLQITTSDEENALELVCGEMGLKRSQRTDPSLGKYIRLHHGQKLLALVVKTQGMGAVGNQSSTVRAWGFQAATGATAILQIGMAFGVRPDLQKPGEVLVAKSILPYDQCDINGINGVETVTYPRVSPIAANLDVVRSCERYRDAWKATHPDIEVRFGAILSGGAAIACTAFRDRLYRNLLDKAVDPIVGGEMEGVGLIGVGGGHATRWGIIKGVSDFAEDDRKQSDSFIANRARACKNAVRFTLGMLLQRVASEHYGE